MQPEKENSLLIAYILDLLQTLHKTTGRFSFCVCVYAATGVYKVSLFKAVSYLNNPSVPLKMMQWFSDP